MAAWNVTIAGATWREAGGDVNWQDYGGRWVRPADYRDPDGLWYGLRYDEGTEEYGACVTIFEVYPEDVSDGALRCCEVPGDGMDEYGKAIDPMDLRAWRVEAAMSYGEGRVEQVSAPVGNRQAGRLRAVAARYAMGGFIGKHPFSWSPLRCRV